MKNTFFTLLLLCLTFSLSAQNEYEISIENPYGKVNPNAPAQTADFAPLIGLCDCTSTSRNPDGTWAVAVNMTWQWKYIMNGMAVQDETLKADGKHSGSIRQYNSDSLRWYVHYYASTTAVSTLPTWEGNKTEDGKIVFYRERKAPNGMDGFYRLSFYDIDEKGYKWVGEWVNTTETIVYPTWRISCARREE